jgi:hypothetical protein
MTTSDRNRGRSTREMPEPSRGIVELRLLDLRGSTGIYGLSPASIIVDSDLDFFDTPVAGSRWASRFNNLPGC